MTCPTCGAPSRVLTLAQLSAITPTDKRMPTTTEGHRARGRRIAADLHLPTFAADGTVYVTTADYEARTGRTVEVAA